MKVGVPTEIKHDENRVSVTPGGVDVLVRDGIEVLVQRGAGLGSGIQDMQYEQVGATMIDSADKIWALADLIVKVKEPVNEELTRARSGQVIFTFFHFAASEPLLDAMLKARACCVAFETVGEGPKGPLPLLTPMSEVAGRMAVQEGAKYLEKQRGGRGILLGGVPGVRPASVLVIGGGVVGSNAAKMAAGLGARVVLMDIDVDRLRHLSDVLPANVITRYSNRVAILEELPLADLVIGAVLLCEGAKAPKLITRPDLQLLPPGAVIVDVAVDQGGCVETIRPTTHSEPTYEVDGVIHYGVANMPGAVPRTSTFALANATLPFVRLLARYGLLEALRREPRLREGVNVVDGFITHKIVAEAFQRKAYDVDEVLARVSMAGG
eukprot:TRINITY_DN10074_c0_g1_i1.p1 TRINITY_DN10074_c0_g1~~TRINITY_DN10074_c0_g1_i1.p1  ORF type:complete len:381 (+),score=85.38 TRINITY_DN10074_c0_g1_i1:68-1210(+)